jgi:hypothetical protein
MDARPRYRRGVAPAGQGKTHPRHFSSFKEEVLERKVCLIG